MKPVRFVLYYTAAIALFGMAYFSPLGLAAAQGSGSPCSGKPCQIPNLFDPDLADLKSANNQALDDFIKGALDRTKGGNNGKDRGCYPLPITIEVFTKPHPEDFNLQSEIQQSRMDVLVKYFNKHGLDPQKNVEQVDGLSWSKTDGTVEGTYNDVDRDPPKLKVSWNPAPGTPVKEGDQIKVRITASERHADGHRSWPTGVQSIQVIANGTVEAPSGDYRPPQPCERRILDKTYIVPKNPPSIVHLEAYAEDGANHNASETADFPIGDWYGTLREHAQGNLYNDTVVVLFSFKEERDGTIKGGGRAKLTSEPQSFNKCVVTRTLIRSDESELPISGKRVCDQFHLELPTDSTLKIRIKSDCPAPQTSGTTEGRRSLGLSEVFYHPKVKARDGATNSFHTPGAMDVSGSIEIHHAKR